MSEVPGPTNEEIGFQLSRNEEPDKKEITETEKPQPSPNSDQPHFERTRGETKASEVFEVPPPPPPYEVAGIFGSESTSLAEKIKGRVTSLPKEWLNPKGGMIFGAAAVGAGMTALMEASGVRLPVGIAARALPRALAAADETYQWARELGIKHGSSSQEDRDRRLAEFRTSYYRAVVNLRQASWALSSGFMLGTIGVAGVVEGVRLEMEEVQLENQIIESVGENLQNGPHSESSGPHSDVGLSHQEPGESARVHNLEPTSSELGPTSPSEPEGRSLDVENDKAGG